MDDVALANYLAGLTDGPVEAGRIDPPIAKALAAKPSAPVWLSDYSITKTKYRHKDITFEDYIQIPVVLREGFVAYGKTARTVEICYIARFKKGENGYRLCLKSTRGGIFITTFHRLSLAEIRRHARKARKQDKLVAGRDQLARCVLHRANK